MDGDRRKLADKRALRRLDPLAPRKAHAQPWDQLASEDSLWFARFEIYRQLPREERSVRSAFVHYCRDSGKTVRPDLDKPPANWSEMATKYRWVVRAQAYDAWVLEREREALERQKAQLRVRRVQALEKVQTLITDEIERLLADPAKVADLPFDKLVRALALTMREQRTEFGEASVIARNEHTGADGRPIQHQVAVADATAHAMDALLERLDVDDIRALRRLRSKVLETDDDPAIIDADVRVLDRDEVAALEDGLDV